MGLQLVTDASVEPVTLAQAKLWLGVETGDTAFDKRVPLGVCDNRTEIKRSD